MSDRERQGGTGVGSTTSIGGAGGTLGLAPHDDETEDSEDAV